MESPALTNCNITNSPKAALLLGRVLRHETNVSTLLAFCVVLAPEPLQQKLRLSSPIIDARVEVPHRKSNRIDIVLDGPAGPQALLELKISATEHGDQLKRYEDFAKKYEAQRFLIDLEPRTARTHPGWKRLNVGEVFACWSHSAISVVRELATAAATIFHNWTAQASGPIGEMDPAMVPVVLRAAANNLTSSGIETLARKTSGGRPALIAMMPHPLDPENTSLCTVVRQDKGGQTPVWRLRIGVQVVKRDDGSHARATAHRHMLQLERNLNLGPLQESFELNNSTLAAKISSNRPLKIPRDRDAQIARWLNETSAAESGRFSNQPVFYNDFGGRRLSAQFDLAVPDMTFDNLTEIIRTTMNHLERSINKDASVTNPRKSSK